MKQKENLRGLVVYYYRNPLKKEGVISRVKLVRLVKKTLLDGFEYWRVRDIESGLYSTKLINLNY